jgi:preprotein translocase subunit SecE
VAATNTTTGTTGTRKGPTIAPPSRLPQSGAPRPQASEGGLIGGLTRWAREVRSELRKVVWPSRDDIKNLTAITIAVSVAVGTILGTIDALFEQLFRHIHQR